MGFARFEPKSARATATSERVPKRFPRTSSAHLRTAVSNSRESGSVPGKAVVDLITGEVGRCLSQHGGEGDTRFNVGGVIDFTEMHHLLLSAGRSLQGSNLFQGYVAYQLTFGPKE